MVCSWCGFRPLAGEILALVMAGFGSLGCAEATRAQAAQSIAEPAVQPTVQPIVRPVAQPIADPSVGSQPAPGARSPGPAVSLVPTKVNTGDCVADRVSIDYSLERVSFDEVYCRAGNPDDLTAYRVCLRNSALNDTAFFTDRCGDGSEYFLSVDGSERRLQRVGPAWAGVNLSGRFAGDGLALEVLPLQELGNDLPKDDPEMADSGAWRVRVTIRRGAMQRTFDATLTYGP